jgi:hypothetical protein
MGSIVGLIVIAAATVSGTSEPFIMLPVMDYSEFRTRQARDRNGWGSWGVIWSTLSKHSGR